jgi:hypothetical protein
MTKYKKNKKTNKRSQRGGGWLDYWPFTSSNGDQGYGSQASALGAQASQKVSAIGEEVSDNAQKAKTYLESFLGSSQEPVSNYSPSSATSATSATSNYSPSPTTPQTMGGKKRRKMRGGKGGLGLTYYATPVLKSNVVEPNEWLFYNNGTNFKGGSRKRGCKTRKCKTRKCKTRKCKTRKR